MANQTDEAKAAAEAQAKQDAEEQERLEALRRKREERGYITHSFNKDGKGTVK